MESGSYITEKLNFFLKTYDLTVQQYNILRILRGQNFKPINLYMLQEHMLHKMSNTTRLVEKLRLKELLERKVSENNRRKVEIVITDKGLGLLYGIDEALEAYEKQIISSLNKEEQNLLVGLLEKLNH